MFEKIKKRPRLFAIFGLAALGSITTLTFDNSIRTDIERAAYLAAQPHLTTAQQQKFYNFIAPDLREQQRRKLAKHNLEDFAAFDTQRANTFDNRTNIYFIYNHSPVVTQKLDSKLTQGFSALPAFARSLLSDFDLSTHTGNLISSVNPTLGNSPGSGTNGIPRDYVIVGLTQTDYNFMIFPVSHLRAEGGTVSTGLESSQTYTDNILGHEVGHFINARLGNRSGQADYLTAVQNDLENLNWRTRSFAMRVARKSGLPDNPEEILAMSDTQLDQELVGPMSAQELKSSLADGYRNVRGYLRSRQFGRGSQDTLQNSASEIFAQLTSIYFFRERGLVHPEDKLANEMPSSYAIVKTELDRLKRYYSVAEQPIMLRAPR